MKNKKTKIKILLGFTFLGIVFTISNTPKAYSQDLIPSENIRQYVKSEIAPVMKPYRVDFEKSLTMDEKKQIEQIRVDLKAIKAKREQLGVKPAALLKTSLTDEQVAVMKSTRDKAYKSLIQAAAIVANHEQELNRIFEEQKIHRNTWTQEINRIVSDEHPLLKNRYRHYFFNNIQRLLPANQAGQIAFVLWNPEK